MFFFILFYFVFGNFVLIIYNNNNNKKDSYGSVEATFTCGALYLSHHGTSTNRISLSASVLS